MSATDNIHEQVAAYALNALDDDERHEFELHLQGCDECRAQLPAFADAAAALALDERAAQVVHELTAPLDSDAP